MLIFVLTIIFILLLVFWCIQFLNLMRMQATDFPAREDKVVWAVAMILLGALGALLFWIQFKPTSEVIPQLEADLYEKIKNTYPEHQAEIELALKMSSLYRCDLEKWYGKKSSADLINRYRCGPTKDVEPGCFGVLLAVLTAREIEI